MKFRCFDELSAGDYVRCVSGWLWKVPREGCGKVEMISCVGTCILFLEKDGEDAYVFSDGNVWVMVDHYASPTRWIEN